MIHPTLTQTQFVLPLPIDDQYLSSSSEAPGFQPEGIISLMECYVQAVKLQDILGQVLATFYNRGSHDQEADFETEDTHESRGKDKMKDSDLQMLLNVDGLLNGWHKKLPVHLRVQTYRTGDTSAISSDPTRVSVFSRQATVLEAR